jgi:hypothetical protein
MQKILAIPILILSIGLSGCTTARFGVGKPSSLLSKNDRVVDLTWTLFLAASEFCPFDVEPAYGFSLERQHDGGNVHPPATSTLVISAVVPGLPAQRQGLPVGAVVLAVNDEPVEQLDPEEVLKKAKRAALAKIEPLSVRVRYNGRVEEFNLESVRVCRYEVAIIDADTINAYSDGRRITLTRGVLEFVSNDDELSFVLAHEIAHNILQHPAVFKFNQTLESFLRAVGPESDGSKSLEARQGFEIEADKLALYIMARAGRDLEAALSLMARLNAREPDFEPRTYSGAHPPTRTRWGMMEETIREIEKNPSATHQH